MTVYALGVQSIGVMILSYACAREELGWTFMKLIMVTLVLEIPLNLMFGFYGVIIYFPIMVAPFLVATSVGIILGQNRKLKEDNNLLTSKLQLIRTVRKIENEIKVLAET